MTRAELIGRLKAAEELDATLFVDVCDHLDIYKNATDKWLVQLGHFVGARAWTDAALALGEQCLPGWSIALISHSNGAPCVAEIYAPRGHERHTGIHWSSSAPTPALAILIALLTALEAKEQQP